MVGNGSAGHDPEGMGEILSLAEQAARKAHETVKRFERAVGEVSFPDDPLGRDMRDFLHRHLENHIAQANDFQDTLQRLIDNAEDAMRAQRHADEESAERFHDDEREW